MLKRALKKGSEVNESEAWCHSCTSNKIKTNVMYRNLKLEELCSRW